MYNLLKILQVIADYKAWHGATVILDPENEPFAPVRVKEGQRLRILGKVIGVLRKL